jgi:hypothetical protein
MSTANNIDGKPVVITGLTDGQGVIYNQAQDRWENGAAGGGGGIPQLVGNLLRSEIDDLLLATEVKLGGFFLEPDVYSPPNWYFGGTVILTDGGGAAPTVEFRLYDMGPVNTPTLPDLRSSVTVSTTGSVQTNSNTLTIVNVLTPLPNEILNAPRMYEVRAVLTGDVGDRVDIDWAGIQGGN